MPLAKVRIKPERQGEKSIKMTTATVRLPQNVKGQNRTGNGNPNQR